MAYFKTGTANNHIDLLDILVNFLSTELPLAERWQVIRYTGLKNIVASSFVVNFEPWTAFKGPYGNHANGWGSSTGQPSNQWIKWEMVQPMDIRRLKLTGSATTNKSPNTFSLDWSNDGVSWTTLESWSGQTWTASQVREYAITAASPGAKKYWRIFVTSNNGNTTNTEILNIELPVFEVTADFDHSRMPAAWLKAPGLTGLDPCYINFQIYDRPTNDYYNLALTGATGFVGASDFDNQPGARAALALPLWNQPIPYWIMGNGQRVVVTVKVDTIYLSFYVGKINTFGTPGQFPYPLLIAAPLATAAAVRYSDGSVAMPYRGNTTRMVLRDTAGTWQTPRCHPYSKSDGSTIYTFRDTNGSYCLLPLTLHDASNVYGVLDGLAHVSGFGNAVENTVTVGAETHTVFQDKSLNGFNDFYTQRTA